MSDSVIQINNYHIRSDTGKIYFTFDDLQEMPEWPDASLLEIINGDLFVVPSHSIIHQRIERKLSFLIMQYIEKNRIGELFLPPVDVKLDDENVVIPNLVFISEGRKSIITEKYIQGVPDMIVEILSSNRKRDLEDKMMLY